MMRCTPTNIYMLKVSAHPVVRVKSSGLSYCYSCVSWLDVFHLSNSLITERSDWAASVVLARNGLRVSTFCRATLTTEVLFLDLPVGITIVKPDERKENRFNSSNLGNYFDKQTMRKKIIKGLPKLVSSLNSIACIECNSRKAHVLVFGEHPHWK